MTAVINFIVFPPRLIFAQDRLTFLVLSGGPALSRQFLTVMHKESTKASDGSGAPAVSFAQA
jgi:hypothetical protein